MSTGIESKPIVRVDGLTAAYNETIILDNITFEVNKGEIFFIVGGSGCGKSTLMKHIIGLYKPQSGKIFFNGQDMISASEPERLNVLKNIGVMYQNGALFGSMTLLENVRLPLEEFTDLPPEAINLISSMKLKMVGLKGFERYMPSELSGGMQKRAAIARAMALDPQILFLDEPSAGLDPITSAELDQLIQSLSRDMKITFVIVSHELPSIYAIADRVIMLYKGTRGVFATGTPQELRDHCENQQVRQFFNREVSHTL